MGLKRNSPIFHTITSPSSECSAQGQVLHCKCRNLGCSSAEDRSSTANSGTKAAVSQGIELMRQHPVAFRTLLSFSLVTEQTLKGLKRSQGHKRGGEESGFG